MRPDHELLDKHRQECGEKARSLKAYVEELTAAVAKYGTDDALVKEDLNRAKNDAQFYEEEVERCCQSLGADAEEVAYRVYQDEAGEWRWNLRASNGRIIADSGEGYRHRHDCLHGIELVKGSAKAAVREG